MLAVSTTSSPWPGRDSSGQASDCICERLRRAAGSARAAVIESDGRPLTSSRRRLLDTTNAPSPLMASRARGNFSCSDCRQSHFLSPLIHYVLELLFLNVRYSAIILQYYINTYDTRNTTARVKLSAIVAFRYRGVIRSTTSRQPPSQPNVTSDNVLWVLGGVVVSGARSGLSCSCRVFSADIVAYVRQHSVHM